MCFKGKICFFPVFQVDSLWQLLKMCILLPTPFINPMNNRTATLLQYWPHLAIIYKCPILKIIQLLKLFQNIPG